MSDVRKPIRLSAHAHGQLTFRGVTEQEIVEAIRTAPWEPAELGRLECRKNYPFGSIWHGKPYATKQPRPIFADEPAGIVVVTVFAYYF